MTGTIATILRAPFTARTWNDTAFLVLGIVTGAIAFGVSVAFWSFGPLLVLTVLGWPLVLLAFYLMRGTAELDRRRAAIVLGEPLRGRYRRPPNGRFLSRFATAFRDPQTWADSLWLFLAGPIGLAGAIVATSFWLVGIGSVTAPLWWWAVPDGEQHGVRTIGIPLDSWANAGYTAAAGIGVLLVAPWAIRGLTFVIVALLRALLAGKRAALEERVDELTETRAGVVNVQAEELQRIERDLHDGAQARLVAVAMGLGLAREKLESDPAAAQSLVVTAHEEAKTAIRELRDLVRGIHPSILTDRGLEPAVQALVARSPVPAALSVDLGRRLPTAVEACAYFVVNEALTNVAKHSGARRCDVSVDDDGKRLRISVRDDGVGGADASAGSGIAGLERRVRALDGTLEVTSPPGGPTVLVAEIPCES